MKKSLIFTSIIVTSYLAIPAASYANDNVALRICEYVQANDKNRLRAYLKQQKLKLRDIFDDIRCNQKNLLVFAAANQSLETGEFIIGKIPAKQVAESYDDVTKHSAHLSAEVKKRIE